MVETTTHLPTVRTLLLLMDTAQLLLLPAMLTHPEVVGILQEGLTRVLRLLPMANPAVGGTIVVRGVDMPAVQLQPMANPAVVDTIVVLVEDMPAVQLQPTIKSLTFPKLSMFLLPHSPLPQVMDNRNHLMVVELTMEPLLRHHRTPATRLRMEVVLRMAVAHLLRMAEANQLPGLPMTIHMLVAALYFRLVPPMVLSVRYVNQYCQYST